MSDEYTHGKLTDMKYGINHIELQKNKNKSLQDGFEPGAIKNNASILTSWPRRAYSWNML